MNFSRALELIKESKPMRRVGWAGKGLRVEMCTNTVVSTNERLMSVQPHFVLISSDNVVNTWVPSISDILADDWEEVKNTEV